MPTKFDHLCDFIADIEISEKAAEELIQMMSDYQSAYPQTMRSLNRISGFRKLWDALDNMAHASAHDWIAEEEGEQPVADRQQELMKRYEGGGAALNEKEMDELRQLMSPAKS